MYVVEKGLEGDVHVFVWPLPQSRETEERAVSSEAVRLTSTEAGAVKDVPFVDMVTVGGVPEGGGEEEGGAEPVTSKYVAVHLVPSWKTASQAALWVPGEENVV